MRVRYLLYIKKSAFVILFIMLAVSGQIFPQKKVVGYYYPPMVSSVLTVSNMEFSNITHINHSFVWPTKTGEITTDNGVLYPELITAAHKAGKKILIAFGGWGQSDNFAPVTADSVLRVKFVKNITDFVVNNRYDGVDFDWEFPADMQQSQNLTSLVKELRESFNKVNPVLLITMAVTTSDWVGKYFDYDKLVNYIDWFNLMAYDFHGTWTKHAGHNAPLYSSAQDYDGSANDGVNYLNITRKIPKQKIMLGVPFYGKEFNASGLYKPASGDVTDTRYVGASNRMASGQWEYYWDDVSKVPYLLNLEHTKFVTFDDTVSMRIKGEYVLKNDLAGIMIWALGQDVVNDRQPLLETIGKVMGLMTVQVEANRSSIAREYKLYNNYPNPFNPSTRIRISIAEAGNVRLTVYNSIGQKISILADKEFAAGTHEFTFSGGNLPSGVYICQMASGSYMETKKMILAK